MRKIVIFLLIVFTPFVVFSQEVSSNIYVDYSSIKESNNNVFETLKRDLTSFINNKSWIDKKLPFNQRLKLNIGIIINEKTSINSYKGIIAIQSLRPVFNSAYDSPMLNFQDTYFSFKYTENQSFNFNDRKFSENNLIDVIAYYIYIALGYDADSFTLYGGEESFRKAKMIVNNSANKGFDGWKRTDGQKNRASFVDFLLDEKAKKIREINYTYHLKGLDTFAKSEIDGKKAIFNSLMELDYYRNDYQFYPIDIFISAKREEIANIFSDGQNIGENLSKLKTLLETISPINKDTYWKKIKK